jgi:peptidoglycan/LPS O-acetylase OafA/YrhL
MTTTETPPTAAAPAEAPARADSPAPPAEVPGRPRRFAAGLAALAVLGLGVRLAYLLGWHTPWPLVGDAAAVHTAALRLADGHDYVRTTGLTGPPAPAFVAVLALASRLGLRTVLDHQVVACLLGAGGIVAMGLAARRIAGERVGLIVAAIVALSPTVFATDTLLLADTLVVTTTGLLLLAAYRWWDLRTPGAAAWFGAAVGLATLVRPTALVLGAAVALPFAWWRGRAAGRAAVPAQLAVAALALAAVLGPWLLYDVARHDRPAALTGEVEHAVAEANCDAAYDGDATGYRSTACDEPLGRAVDGARAYAGDHAGRAGVVAAARVGRTFGLYQPRDQIERDADDAGREIVLGEVGLVAWYAIGVAGAFGLIGLRRVGRPIFPIVAIVAGVALTSALVYGQTVWRLPAELALAVPAAVSIDAAVSAMWANRSRRLAPPAVGIAEPAPGAPPTDSEAPGDPGADVVAKPEETAPADTAADPPGGLGSAAAGRFAGFDGMRGLAAMGVLVTHVSLHVGFSVRDRTGPYLSRLDVGVAVFFALSGFLLYRPFVARRMDGRPRPSTRDYLRNRFLRIFPGYWLALTILAVVLDVRGRADIQSFGDFVRYYGLLQSYSNATTLGGLQQAWTLTNEVAFYILLPFWAIGAAWLYRRLGPRRAVLAELAVLGAAALGALTLVYQVHSFGNDDVTTGTFDARLHWLPANFHLFVPGMALAVVLEWSRRRERPLRLLESLRRHPMLCWAGAAACFWAVSTQLDLGFQVGATEPGQAVIKEALYAGTGFLLVLPVALAGATLPRSLRWLGSRPMVVLGVLSYGIYLWHEGVTDIYRDIFNVPIFNGSFPAALAFTIAGSVAVAAVSYFVVERPALALKDRHRRLFSAWHPVGLPAGAAA